jgi:hypothetical protein
MDQKSEKIIAELKEKLKEWDLLPKPKENLDKRVEKARTLINERFDDVYQVFKNNDFELPPEMVKQFMKIILSQLIVEMTYGKGIRRV